MPVGTDTCAKILNCCGRSSCCPETVLPDELEAVVTSTCPALNGVVTLTRVVPADPNEPLCWTGTLTISGCFDCTILRVDLCCESTPTGTGTELAYHWDLAWTVFHTGGIILCAVTSSEEPVTFEETCGPPLHVVRTETGLTLSDVTPPSTGTCCTGFSITIEVTGPS